MKKHTDKMDGQNKNAKGNNKKVKNKKNTSNKKLQKQEEAWKKVPPKDKEPKEKSAAARLTIGVSTTWPGECTPPRNIA
jgi:hypothetical protein